MTSASGAGDAPRYRLGWSVGPWHRDSGGSRDALVLLDVAEDVPRLSGPPWRGTLEDGILGRRGPELIDALLRLVAPHGEACSDLVIAIGAPLGWPDALVELQVMGLAVPAIGDPDGNRYLFRETEIALARRCFRTPLRVPQDARASRSTKAVHALRAAGFERERAGVWRLDAKDRRVSAVETHPAVIATARRLCETQGAIESSPLWRSLPETGEDAMRDLRDALACAVLAHLWADRPDSCEPIPEHASLGEGWIVVPAGIGA